MIDPIEAVFHLNWLIEAGVHMVCKVAEQLRGDSTGAGRYVDHMVFDPRIESGGRMLGRWESWGAWEESSADDRIGSDCSKPNTVDEVLMFETVLSRKARLRFVTEQGCNAIDQ